MSKASEIVKKAESQKGNKGTKYWKAYGVPKGTAWCVIFIWWVFKDCKASKLFCNGEKTAWVPTVDEWGKKAKLIVKKDSGKAGDIIVFDWGNDGTRDHVGIIVKKNKNGSYKTIEGNTSGGKVDNKTRYQSDIHHIIRPKYEAGVKKPFNLTRKLKQGCTGSDVKQLQKKLGVTADGIFGAKTKAALVKYQKSKGWIPSGVVRTKTAHSFGWTYKGK